MIWALEVESDNPHFSRDCYQTALAQGLLIRPIGNTVYLMPPYVISEDVMAQLVGGVLNLLERM
jgi:adenosylmethionine-8-amino-7-oxononanoate aminotransferase